MIEQKCSCCGEVKDIGMFNKHSERSCGHRRDCKECRRIKRKTYRLEHGEHIAELNRLSKKRNPEIYKAINKRRKIRIKTEYPVKFKAWKKASKAISEGRIIRQHCCICGNPQAEAHHTDYTQPFKITWMCRKCHGVAHKMGLGGIDFGSYPYNINAPKYPIIDGVEQRDGV